MVEKSTCICGGLSNNRYMYIHVNVVERTCPWMVERRYMYMWKYVSQKRYSICIFTWIFTWIYTYIVHCERKYTYMVKRKCTCMSRYVWLKKVHYIHTHTFWYVHEGIDAYVLRADAWKSKAAHALRQVHRGFCGAEPPLSWAALGNDRGAYPHDCREAVKQSLWVTATRTRLRGKCWIRFPPWRRTRKKKKKHLHQLILFFRPREMHGRRQQKRERQRARARVCSSHLFYTPTPSSVCGWVSRRHAITSSHQSFLLLFPPPSVCGASLRSSFFPRETGIRTFISL